MQLCQALLYAQAQLFGSDMNHMAGERTDATILRGVDWTRVREGLQACRAAAKLNQSALARAIGVNKSTVNRIENVYGEPDHVPDLDTIERWVLATGVKLSDFFRRIEVAPGGATDAQPAAEVSTHAPAPVASPSVDLAPFAAFGAALGRSVVEAFRDSQRKADARARKKPRRRQDDRGDARRRA